MTPAADQAVAGTETVPARSRPVVAPAQRCRSGAVKERRNCGHALCIGWGFAAPKWESRGSAEDVPSGLDVPAGEREERVSGCCALGSRLLGPEDAWLAHLGTHELAADDERVGVQVGV